MNLRKVLDRLEQRGLKVNQGNSEKLTDKNGKPIGVRLKVSMFKKGFDCLRFQSYNKKCEHSVYDHRTSRNKRKQLNGRLLATGIKIKEV